MKQVCSFADNDMSVIASSVRCHFMMSLCIAIRVRT